MADFGAIPDWITAIASTGTLTVAVVAAKAAFKQVGEARELREDQARPFVVVDFEPNLTGHPHMDLVIRNTGATVAHDVILAFDPPLASTFDDDPAMKANVKPMAEWSLFSKPIPSIAPGKEYRVLFEDMTDRYKRDDLPRRYEVTVAMRGLHGRTEKPLVQTLDLDVYFGSLKITEHSTHHIAKTLRAWAKKDGVSSF